MAPSFSLSLSPLLQVARALPDTVYTIEAGGSSFFHIVEVIAGALMTLAVLLLAIGLIPIAWHSRQTYLKVNQLIDRFHTDLGPVIRDASVITANVRDISNTVKHEIHAISETVGDANDRLATAVRGTQTRLEQFNALLGIVHDEVKETVVSSLATVRGVQEGIASVFTPRGTSHTRSGLSDDEEDDLYDDRDDDLYGDLDNWEDEDDDGYGEPGSRASEQHVRDVRKDRTQSNAQSNIRSNARLSDEDVDVGRDRERQGPRVRRR